MRWELIVEAIRWMVVSEDVGSVLAWLDLQVAEGVVVLGEDRVILRRVRGA